MSKTELGTVAGRVYRIMAGLAVIGAAGAAVVGGMTYVAGFLVGALFSAINFGLWHRVVGRIGVTASDDRPPRKASTLAFALRYGGFAVGLYVILQFFEGSLPAALAGCFIAVAAVVLEALIELFYGT